jgi:tetratricopeptide (TPR) repeat protein
VRPSCGNSDKQLKELQEGSRILSSAGIALFVVALSSRPDGFASSSLPIHLADEHSIGAWNIQYRYLFDRRRDMSMPLSFLLNAEGAIVRVYQGVVAPQSVVEDWKSAPASPVERFARAMPFPGPYYGGGMKHDYMTYGIAFAEYGYVDQAQAAFQHAIDANPSLQIAWFNLGTIYLNKKMYSDARKCLSEAVRLNPRDADAWNNLGMLSGEEQKYDEALDQFRHAAEANPELVLAVENMMRIYRFQNRAADAQKTLEQLLAKTPDNADLHLALAMTLVAQNDLQQARKELETSIQLRPNSPDALNNLGAVLLRLGLTADALNRFDESRRLAPDFDRPCINAAMVYKSQGRPDKARELLTAFLVGHPGDADVQSALEKLGPP